MEDSLSTSRCSWSWKEFLLDSRSTTFGSFRRRWWGFWSFKWIQYLDAEVEIRLPSRPLSPRSLPPPKKTIFLENTSVLGIRALNNVETWVTYWKWWLYAGPSLDRSSFILPPFSSTSPPVFFPFSLSLSFFSSVISSRSTWYAQPYKLPTIPYLSDLYSHTILASIVEPSYYR